jgi:site-specific DNA recombinase
MKTETKKQESVLKDILSGKYRDTYLVYNRKSTDDTENQKNSIKYQKSENARYALREGLEIADITLEGFATNGIISERHSGFKEDSELTFGADGTVQYNIDRPKFYRLAQFLNKHYFKGVIILCWDRASRNKGDDTILRKLMKNGVDIRFTLSSYDKTSAGELHMDIDGMFAEHHSRVTREKVTITIRHNRAQGIVTHKAPVGYLNEGVMSHKAFDPIRAPIIEMLFDMAATGEYSLADMARWAIEQGFTMPPVRRRRTQEEILAEEEDDMRLEIEAIERLPTFNSIHKILTNPFYAGKTKGNDGVYVTSTSHEPLVSEELFDMAQEQLSKRNKSAHYIKLLDHPLRGIAHCAVCERLYTPYLKKGVVYYGARCRKECSNPLKSFNFDFLVEKVGELIDKLVFTEDEIEKINAFASTDLVLLETKRENKLEIDERKKKKIREELAYLNANRIPLLKAGVYTPEGYVEEEARLSSELAGLRTSEEVSDLSMRETVKDVILLSELLQNVAEVYSFAKPQVKDKIIRVIFSEFTISENTFDFQCTKGFEPLSSRFIANCDPTGNRTPISCVKGGRPNR